MKIIPHFLVAGAVVFGTACSSTSSTGTGASTGGSTITDTSTSQATSGVSTSDSGTSGTGTSGASGTGSTVPGANGTVTTAGPVGATGAGATSDQTAFMATFATMDDATFMLTAASSNMLEMQLGQLATQKSMNADVKKYGQMMVDHHTKASQQWKAVATPLKVQMPTTLMPVHQAIYDKVASQSSGKQFDEAYMDAMETAHMMDVAMFEAKSNQAQTPTVKSFANQTLPMLRSHHQMADKVEKKAD